MAFAMLCALISACGETSSGSTTPTATGTTVAAGPNCVNGSITFDGSTALYPLANGVANAYQDACSGATITAKQSGSGAGLSAAAAGTVDIGNSDIFAGASTPGLSDNQVAVVVFSVVLNGHVTGVTNLTHQQLIDIYTGKDTNWNQVGGPNLPIVTVSRSPGSGTRATFDQYILNGGSTTPTNVEATGSSNLVASQSSDLSTDVKNTSGAIGYVASFYAKQNGLHTIQIDGVSDDSANVENNTYPLWNIEHMYTKGAATGLAKAFIDYVKGNAPEVVSARQANGFLALGDMQQSALTAKQPK